MGKLLDDRVIALIPSFEFRDNGCVYGVQQRAFIMAGKLLINRLLVGRLSLVSYDRVTRVTLCTWVFRNREALTLTSIRICGNS